MLSTYSVHFSHFNNYIFLKLVRVKFIWKELELICYVSPVINIAPMNV